VGNLEQNYLVFVPVPDPGTMRPFIAAVSPAAGAEVQNAAPDRYATIANRDTSTGTNSVRLFINDKRLFPPNVTFTATPGGVQVTWLLSALPSTETITNTIAYSDNTSVWQTNTWTYSYPFLSAANSLPVGSLNLRGFDARMVQTDNGGANLDNSLIRAEQQLAIPPEIPYERTATSIIQVLDWNKTAQPPNNVPGLCPGSYNNIAVESFAYLELTAGAHRFHIITDDRSGLYSGTGLKQPGPVALWENSGSTANNYFDFVVGATGLYPLRSVWEETGGSSVLQLWSVNADGSEVLINDATNMTGVVKGWYPLVCLSSAAVTGPYTADATAVNTPTLANVLCPDTMEVIDQMVVGGTLNIPAPSATRFYQLGGPRATKITRFVPSGANLLVSYEVRFQ